MSGMQPCLEHRLVSHGIDPTPTPPDNLGPGFMTTPLGESGQQPRADLQNWRKKHNIRFGQSPFG